MNFVRAREKDPGDTKTVPGKGVIPYLRRKCPALEEYSEMAMVSLLRNSKLVELHSRKRKNTATTTYTSAHEIEDPYRLGFFFLLTGRCNLVFEVLKLRKAADVSCAQSEQDGPQPRGGAAEDDLNDRTMNAAQYGT